MTWILKNTDPVLTANLIKFEGSKEAQARLGYFRNGKFWTYKDHLGFPTIGFGRLLKKNETYPNGITEAEALSMLAEDITRMIISAQLIYTEYKMNIPEDGQRVIVEMCFQMGAQGVRKFQNTLKALARNDYKATAQGMRNSLWYRQTTNRAEVLAKRIEALK